MANLETLQTSEYTQKVQNSTLTVLLDFSANWCAPCKRLAPILEELSTEWSGKAVIYTIDADKNSDLVGKFGIMSLPTLVLIKNGEEIHRLIGLQSKEKLVAEFGSLI